MATARKYPIYSTAAIKKWFVQLPIIGGWNEPFFLVSPYRAHIRSAHARLRPLRKLRGIFLMGASTPPFAKEYLQLSCWPVP